MAIVDIFTDVEALEKLIPEWDELSSNLLPWMPFKSAAWLITWWRHFRRDSFLARDELRVYTIRDSGGNLLGVCPMMVTFRPGKGPFQTRELQFLGPDPYITELRGPICSSENAETVTTALLTHFQTYPMAHWLQGQGFPVPTSLEQRFGFIPDEQLASIDYYLPLPDTWLELKKRLPHNIKKAIRKCYNSLDRAGYTFEFRAVRDPKDIDGALDTFFDLHAQRASLQGTIRHANVFSTLKTQAFLREYCRAQATSGNVSIFQLLINGEVVATRVGFINKSEVYLYFSGYDTAWRQYSVMTTVLVETIKWSIDNGFKNCNLSSGTDIAKIRWRPENVKFYGGYLPSQSFTGKLFVPAAQFLRYRRTHLALGALFSKMKLFTLPSYKSS